MPWPQGIEVTFGAQRATSSTLVAPLAASVSAVNALTARRNLLQVLLTEARGDDDFLEVPPVRSTAGFLAQRVLVDPTSNAADYRSADYYASNYASVFFYLSLQRPEVAAIAASFVSTICSSIAYPHRQIETNEIPHTLHVVVQQARSSCGAATKCEQKMVGLT